jgi:hypothetical protein
VEQDHGDPYREDELRGHPVQRVLDYTEHRWTYERSGGNEQDHLGYPQECRYELRDQTGPQYEAKVP